ncbi:hypothetical protein ACJZ2D_009684 [Fusarium nematophilum]
MSNSPHSTEPSHPTLDNTEDAWETRIRQLPLLPSPRPRALTPNGFRDVDSAPEKTPIALFQKSCSWFRLPPNLRRDILRLAFGDGRLHLHLGYAHPDAARRPIAGRHCGIDSVPSERFRNRRERLVDKSRPKGWQWWGSVCHRLAPNTSLGPMTNGGPDGPWADHCRNGDAKHCSVSRGSGVPSECHVGIMGWALSCRQNYVETVDIVYSTNILIMSGESMLSHLPQLLLPQRLEVMTALEMSWPLKTCHVEDELDKADLDQDHLETILKLLSPSRFPALCHLYLSLEDSDEASFAIHAEEEYIEAILKHLDLFAQRMSHLRECAFALPDQFFDFIYDNAAFILEPHGRYGSYLKSYRQVWRYVDGDTTVVRLPYVDSYPGPPHHLVQANNHVSGYWILEGSDRLEPDTPLRGSCLPDMEIWGMFPSTV